MSVPSATPLLTTVAVNVASPKLVKVTLPLKSPANVIVGDLFMVVALLISPPLMSTVFNIGAVNVLLVRVCVPVRVATVESIATVKELPEPTVSIPVPPATVNVSLPSTIDKAPPLSP